MQTIGSNGANGADVATRPATLPDMVRALAANRKRWAELKDLADSAHKLVQATPEWAVFADLIDQMTAIQGEMDELDPAIRAEALRQYEHDCVRRPCDGVEVKLYQKLVYNPATAELWTRANCPAALAFDPRRFEKVAVELAGAPVNILQEPRATIARDLSAWLQAGA